ncbi:MAG: CDP-alcohol phosphatidyltransferase family protein [Patescibacteria group bacterium]
MFEDRWNKEIVLLPHDRLIKAVIEPLIPHWLLPNHITVFRMLMIAPVVLLLWRENYAVGVPLFLSVALTDALDGSLARIRSTGSPYCRTCDSVIRRSARRSASACSS